MFCFLSLYAHITLSSNYVRSLHALLMTARHFLKSLSNHALEWIYRNHHTKKASAGSLNTRLSIFPHKLTLGGMLHICWWRTGFQLPGEPVSLAAELCWPVPGGREAQEDHARRATCFGSVQQQWEPYVELQENRCCFSICEIKLLESSQLSYVQEGAHPINLQRQCELFFF